MFKRIKFGLKFIFTGEIELPKDFQKAVKVYLDEMDEIPPFNMTSEQSKRANVALGMFTNFVITYLSLQHLPESCSDYKTGAGYVHFRRLVNSRRTDKYWDGRRQALRSTRADSSVSHSDNLRTQ